MSFPSDIDIARGAKKRPIADIAAKLSLPKHAHYDFGEDIAKVDLGYLNRLPEKKNAKLVLVSATSPTPAGEGKTTTTVGLGDALNRIGKRSMICLREPSLGPCFGVKGGAAGGGYAQVIPMEDINLHFSGDFHAIGSAHNLLSAMIDNHIYWGNERGIDTRRVSWKRVLDMNDRSLRQITSSLGGVNNGFPRESGFDITVASEVMAVFCLARDLQDLEERLGRMIVAYTRDKKPILARDLDAHGAMTVLLKRAVMPNLVQTLENNPAFIHGGPFANIAHGCNSVIATRSALKLADYVVTEAGFGADLGAEKFFNIKCRAADIQPSCLVLVTTVRALKMHGGVSNRDELSTENLAALEAGLVNLERHIENVSKFGVPCVVAINKFAHDTEAELERIRLHSINAGANAMICEHFAKGSAGAEDLAYEVTRLCEANVAKFTPLYAPELPLYEKIETIAKTIYRASGISMPPALRAQLEEFEKQGYGKLPVCMAKTQYSFSADPKLLGAPSQHTLPIRELRLNAGAGLVVAVCGSIMTMPGLPRVPAAARIKLDDRGQVQGLF